MKLINPTDPELKMAFGVHVCKWHAVMGGRFWANAAGDIEAAIDEFDWTASVDAVLPWLEKQGFWTCQHSENDGHYTVSDDHLDANGDNASEAETFAKAAVIMLLRAKGVAVEFTQ